MSQEISPAVMFNTLKEIKFLKLTIIGVVVAELSSLRAKRAGPKGMRAESARAVTGRRNSHRWEGGRLFEPSANLFYGNSCNFGTESRKIVSKVGN